MAQCQLRARCGALAQFDLVVAQLLTQETSVTYECAIFETVVAVEECPRAEAGVELAQCGLFAKEWIREGERRVLDCTHC